MILFSSYLSSRTYKLTFINSILIIKRYYPGQGGFPFGANISKSSCNRILKLFDKDNILRTQYTFNQMYQLTNNVYDIAQNRSDFFKTIRKIALDKEMILKKDILQDKNTFIITNMIAEQLNTFRIKNIPIQVKKSCAQQISNEKGVPEPLRGLSLEEKQTKSLEKHNAIIKKMKIVQTNYEKDKNIDWSIIEEWMEYIETRGSIIPDYTSEEHSINSFLRILFNENTEVKEHILSKLENHVNDIKKESKLDHLDLLDKAQQTCFIKQDYIDKIKAINEILKLLNRGEILNNSARIYLAILADAVSLDEANSPKLNREVYVLSNTSPKEFGINYTDKKPNPDEIMDALRNKRYYVKQSSDEIPPGQLVSTAPLLHKTIFIPTKDGLYMAAMFTSSKTDTELLSLTQETNLDPESINKQQRFVVFSQFVLYQEYDVTVDLLALGFSHDINLEGENVHKKIIQFFEDKQHIWANNYVQKLMNITPEYLEKITKIFMEKKLETVMNEYYNLTLKLENMTEDKRNRLLLEYSNDKENYIKEQREQKYLSKLPLNLQKLLIHLNFYEKENKRQKEFAIEREEKASKNKRIEEQLRKLKEEKEKRERTGQLTAKEKREAFQRQLKEKAETKVLIENAKPEQK